MINVKPGEKVYVREDGVIKALKCIKVIGNLYNISVIYPTYEFVDPNGDIFKYNYQPFGGNKIFYSTIEDAMHNIPRKQCSSADYIDLGVIFRKKYGYNFCKKDKNVLYYAWDGYGVTEQHLACDKWSFVWNDGCEPDIVINKELFLSQEDAQKGHETKVIDF